MGGGKSRTGCEEIFNECLNNPGLVAVVARQAHTSIIGTTRKTMIDQVIPPFAIARKKESGGEDWVELFNGSRIHFIGLDDPLRWYSSELGYLFFDEAQEIEEETVVRLLTRLRQPGMPHRAIFTFNPSSPGHWLQTWFLTGGEWFENEYTDGPDVCQGKAEGFFKPELFTTDADSPIGDAFFVYAKATDNLHLPEGYIEKTLGGMPRHLRRRYLEGLWEFTEGNSFFEPETLQHHEAVAHSTKPLFNGRVEGDVLADVEWRRGGQRGSKPKDSIRIKRGDGPLTVWKLPTRKGYDDNGNPKERGRYVISVDVSSGGSHDFSAIHVLSVEDFEQVAEFQGRVKPADLALISYRLGRIYNNALIVPEITGGWGETIKEELRRFSYPNQYTRKMFDRLTRTWTDKLGWDTNRGTRARMLDNLERVLREKEFGLFSLKSVNELATFVYGDDNKPQAQHGCHDDLVMSLAIGVSVLLELPRQIRRPRPERYEPQFSKTGW